MIFFKIDGILTFAAQGEFRNDLYDVDESDNEEEDPTAFDQDIDLEKHEAVVSVRLNSLFLSKLKKVIKLKITMIIGKG